jgi:hypothetical protein
MGKKVFKIVLSKKFLLWEFLNEKKLGKKVFKIVLSKEFLLYKKTMEKFLEMKKKTKSESHYFFYIVKTFYQGKF